MDYDTIALACEKLSYRDKLRLAQLLIQLARKEEENIHPQKVIEQKVIEKAQIHGESERSIDTIEYIEERISKLKPLRKKSLINSIKAMFQFNGGISESDIDQIIAELQKRKFLKIEQDRVVYPQ
jgi:hypothetical protein